MEGEPYTRAIYSKAVHVEAGQWIGRIGKYGEAAFPHSHTEVFEYFYEGKTDGSLPAMWRRINFRSLFNCGDPNDPEDHGIFQPQDRTKFIYDVPEVKAAFPILWDGNVITWEMFKATMPPWEDIIK